MAIEIVIFFPLKMVIFPLKMVIYQRVPLTTSQFHHGHHSCSQLESPTAACSLDWSQSSVCGFHNWISLDWFCWENFNRKPWYLPWNIEVKPINFPLNQSNEDFVKSEKQIEWKRLSNLNFRKEITKGFGFKKKNDFLVGGFNPSEKYESQLGWCHSQYMEK